jgi:hypothetical protein
MDSFGNLFNSPTGIEFEGKTYKLRQASAIECGEYQRHLEQEARATIRRDTSLSEDERREQLADVNADIAAKRYRYGGIVAVKSLRTVEGVAKLISIICADQGMTEAIALRFCNEKLRETIAAIKIAEAEESQDPKELAAIPTMLASLGLPLTFLSSGLSGSVTHPSEPPPTSQPSGDSPSGS